ncbi:very short patch repair endonuclease [Pleomorphomonas carboxyditropha]|uniref:Very short patch repair endonuclease n=2 Tax=Pleomorphomonas carboxyditropha TaxID=2023338 RepID=A0A2G9WSG2_9HYPH|nr:very short patch repair endonuclease [Pleomorphomonas carboxyditropha]
MSRQRVTDTGPELRVRRLLFAAGIRYRKHYPVPGYSRRSIDIAFPRHLLAIFLDGCFWHGCAKHMSMPRANGGWWLNKIEENKRRDSETTTELEARGWRVMRFWEHEEPDTVMMAITRELKKTNGEQVDGQD